MSKVTLVKNNSLWPVVGHPCIMKMTWVVYSPVAARSHRAFFPRINGLVIYASTMLA